MPKPKAKESRFFRIEVPAESTDDVLDKLFLIYCMNANYLALLSRPHVHVSYTGMPKATKSRKPKEPSPIQGLRLVK
jgi:hypothetical protein